MTREEEIQKAASEYIDDLSEKEIDYTQIDYEETTYEAGRCDAISRFGKAIFKAGVEWADEHPTKKQNGLYVTINTINNEKL